MNILLVTNMYPSPSNKYYGIFVREYEHSLREAGHTVDVFFTDGSKQRVNYLKRIPALVSALRRTQYDVIHVQHTFCCYQIACARMFVPKMPPVLLTLHEGEILRPRHVNFSETKIGGRLVYSHTVKLGGLKIADRVASVEKHLPQLLGYDKHYDVIAPGINMELFIPRDQLECRRRLGLAPDEKIIFFPANPKLVLPKGVDLFLEAREMMKMPARTVFGGSIAYEDMPFYINAADVVILSSRYEASPMIIKEAMACNCPIVSTDTGDARFIIGKTRDCYVCDRNPKELADRIDAVLAAGMRTNGRDRVLELGLGHADVVKKYECVYAELTGRTDNGAGDVRSNKSMS